MVLEHDADLAPVQRHAAAAHLEQVSLAEQHRAATGPLGKMDQLEQGALARPGVPGDEQHLADVDIEADVLQRDPAAQVLLADGVETQDGHGRSIADARAG